MLNVVTVKKIRHLEECDVEERRVKVDELKEEFFNSVAVLEVCLGPGTLHVSQPQCDVFVYLIKV